MEQLRISRHQTKLSAIVSVKEIDTLVTWVNRHNFNVLQWLVRSVNDIAEGMADPWTHRGNPLLKRRTVWEK